MLAPGGSRAGVERQGRSLLITRVLAMPQVDALYAEYGPLLSAQDPYLITVVGAVPDPQPVGMVRLRRSCRRVCDSALGVQRLAPSLARVTELNSTMIDATGYSFSPGPTGMLVTHHCNREWIGAPGPDQIAAGVPIGRHPGR